MILTDYELMMISMLAVIMFTVGILVIHDFIKRG